MAQQQVFRRIAGQRQFRGQYDIRPLRSRMARTFHDLCTVAGEVADGAVDLSNGNFDCHVR